MINPDWFVYMISMLFLGYAGGLMLFYSLILLISYRSIKTHIRENYHFHYRQIMSSPVAPKISLLAPAYNEGENIVESVRSLLSLQYSHLEVVIINDGSTDDSLEKLIQAYDLVKVPTYVPPFISTKEIKNVYKSRKSSFSSLIVLDKHNGGKADSLNAGINISSGSLITCVDVDGIIEEDALLRMVKPFMDQHTDVRVIATGGVIRIANDCDIKDGKLIKIRLPYKWIARYQVLEYMRAFFLGRMGWSRLNGLLIISGAFGMFDKKLVIEAGGYSNETVGEDMELIVRMRRIMEERNQKYKVEFIPDPLCWTECPSTWKVLGRQRNRWNRGSIESLLFHRKMLLNPRYGVMGMLSMPYWFLYEWMAPIIELMGLILTIILFITGFLNFPVFIMVFLLVYFFSIMISLFAIYVDQNTYMQYNGSNDHWKLFLSALTEPFFFHPFIVIQAFKGAIDYLRGGKSWGKMTRKGLTSS